MLAANVLTTWRWWVILKNISPNIAQMFHRFTDVEFTTVCPTIAKPMLANVIFES